MSRGLVPLAVFLWIGCADVDPGDELQPDAGVSVDASADVKAWPDIQYPDSRSPDTLSLDTGLPPNIKQWQDFDGDGYGDPKLPSQVLPRGLAGWAPNNKDCNDQNGDVRPGQTRYFTTPITGTFATTKLHLWDYNCDGKVESPFDRYPAMKACFNSYLKEEPCPSGMKIVYKKGDCGKQIQPGECRQFGRFCAAWSLSSWWVTNSCR